MLQVEQPWYMVVTALLVGTFIRHILPYLIKGFTALTNNEPWPAWDWTYMGSLGLSLTGYVVLFLTTPNTWQHLAQMSFWFMVMAAYTGEDLAWRVVKPFIHK